MINRTAKKIIFILIGVVVMILLHVNVITSQFVHAQTTSEMQQKLKETEEKLRKLKEEREKIKNTILSEAQKQASLKQQKVVLDSTIRQNEIMIETLSLEIEKLELELSILIDEQAKLEDRIKELNEELKRLQNEYEISINFLYKRQISSPSLLYESTSLENAILEQEKQKAITTIIKNKKEEIITFENELQEKKQTIIQKKDEINKIKEETVSKYEGLKMQQQALEWQKQNKDKQIQESLNNQKDLFSKDAQLSEEMKRLERELSEYRLKLAVMPPSGAFVKAGQVIGFQGRTGFSCSYYPANPVPRTNNYCSHLGPNWYYYDPVQYPSLGSHLHLEVIVNGQRKNADTYLPGRANNNLVSHPPMFNYVITQSSVAHGGPVDIASYHGAPIYAMSDGYIRYGCYDYNGTFKNDPAYYAVLVHVGSDGKPNGIVTQYWHLLRNVPCP